jgi:cyclophilin family peptidyl-prolyl cis-trans isomerase
MSKKRVEIERRRRLAKTRRSAQGAPRTSHTPPRKAREPEKRSPWDLWLAVGIVVVLVGGMFLLYHFTVRRPLSRRTTPTPLAISTPTAQSESTGPTPALRTPTPAEESAVAKSWSEPPAMQIDVNKSYEALLHTTKGDVRIELFAQQAPNTVNSFVFLARQRFYDGVTFHRVLPGFMAQTGDPTGTGSGGPGYRFRDEFSPSLRHDAEGVVSMANAGVNTNGSQFFITYAPTPHLNDKHSVFGKVTSGMDVVRALTPRNPSTGGSLPTGDAIVSVEILER